MDNTNSSSTFSVSVLLLRILTLLFLLIALIIIAISEYTEITYFGTTKRKFDHVQAYRYMFSTIVVGFAYNLLQLAFSIFTMVSRKRALSGDGGYLFDFYGDKIMSYLLLSGSAAGFGFSAELLRVVPSNPFLEKANASAGLLLVGFIFNAIASIFTSFALPKKPN
ncbi:hypothetical protein VNO77_21598 [Canavalia gladiata]|uniref:CASP-like protein n=1 Tax=Canavalia gladiata TaxID=3824 RepID=A0AAN9QNK8_CANGL